MRVPHLQEVVVEGDTMRLDPGEGLQVDVKKNYRRERSERPSGAVHKREKWARFGVMQMTLSSESSTAAQWNQVLLGFVCCSANISDSRTFTSSSSRRRCFASICRRLSSRLFEVGAVATLDCMACATSTLL